VTTTQRWQTSLSPALGLLLALGGACGAGTGTGGPAADAPAAERDVATDASATDANAADASAANDLGRGADTPVGADAGGATEARKDAHGGADDASPSDARAPNDSEQPRDASSDAAAPDAASTTGCAGATFALCEDFERGTLDATTWRATQKLGTATLDDTRGARGSRWSLHVHVNPGSDTTVGITESRTFPALQKGLFARAFIYIPAAMATSLFTGDRHSRLIYAHGSAPYGEYALGIWNGGLIQNHYSATDDSQDTKMLPPFDRWFCLEYQLDSVNGNVRAYLDGAEITALRHDGWPAANIDTLLFGVDRFGQFAVPEDIWFDELAVDIARIGCTR
jgi:hypothetical protein